MRRGSRREYASVLDDTRQVTRRFTVAVREALLDHKRAGNPVRIWRDGKVVIVPPEEIRVPGEQNEETPPSPSRSQ